MKKKIVGLLVLCVCFFGGWEIIWADSAIDGFVNEWLIPAQWNATTPATPSGSSDDMTSTDFTLSPGFLSPSTKTYDKGTEWNFKELLANIGKYLLIATTTLAVLSIVVGGIMISTTGPTDRAAKGKTIIMLNIMAVVVALFSYSIIQLISWLIS